MAVGINYG